MLKFYEKRSLNKKKVYTAQGLGSPFLRYSIVEEISCKTGTCIRTFYLNIFTSSQLISRSSHESLFSAQDTANIHQDYYTN